MLGPILSTLALVQVRNRVRRAARNAALTAIAGVLGLIAVAFLIAAAFAALLPHLGPVWTSMIAAAVFGLAAMVVVLMRRASRPPDRTPIGGAAMLGALGGTAASAADRGSAPRRPGSPGFLSSRSLLVILPAAAFVAALVAGRRRSRRGWDDDWDRDGRRDRDDRWD